MKDYGGGFMLDIADSHDIIDYCMTMFSFDDVAIEKRVKDAREICRLSLHSSKIATSERECFVTVLKCAYSNAQSMADLEQTLNIFACIKNLDVLKELASECASYAYQLLCKKVSTLFEWFVECLLVVYWMFA